MNIEDYKKHLNNLLNGSAFKFEGKYYILTDKKEDGLLFCVDLKSGHVIYLDPRIEVKTINADIVIS